MKRILGITGGALVMVGGVAASVFVATQIIGQDTQAAGPDDSAATASGNTAPTVPDSFGTSAEPLRVMEIATEKVVDKGSGPVSQSSNLKIVTMPAPGLPQTKPDVTGIYVASEADSIFVGVGSIEATAEVTVVNGEESSSLTLNHDGPEVRVVVTPDTVVYREDTEIPKSGAAVSSSGNFVTNGEVFITQEVTQVDSTDEIGINTEIQAWGTPQGDDLIVEVLVYRPVSID